MVGVFREVWRVLRDDGVCWLNLGDSYAAGKCGRDDSGGDGRFGGPRLEPAQRSAPPGLKPKDLCGIPWRVAFALQADGWYLRSDIIWAKPNPMPESVTDRPTRSHEYLFLLSKNERYYYDSDAIRERAVDDEETFYAKRGTNGKYQESNFKANHLRDETFNPLGRNKRSVWNIATEPTPEAHFATFPQKLIEPCILAGTSEKGCCAECGAPRVRVTVSSTEFHGGSGRAGRTAEDVNANGKWAGKQYGKNIKLGPVVSVTTTGWRPSCAHDAPSVPCTVFDPFLGSGTVGKVCERLGRRWVGLELSESYIEIAKKRTAQRGLFAQVDTSRHVG